MDATPIPGGLLVAIEGIDGAGKTTLARALADVLRSRGLACVLTKEPTSGPWGQQLRATAATGRKDAATELALLLRDRAEHVEHLIAPSLAQGKVVILDRYYFSSIAYQGSAGLDPDDVQRRNEAFAPVPDVLLLLDVEPVVGLERIRARGDVANAFETADNLERCRRIFLATSTPGKHVIDASQSAAVVLEGALSVLLAAAAQKIQKGHGLSKEGINAVLVFKGAEPIPI